MYTEQQHTVLGSINISHEKKKEEERGEKGRKGEKKRRGREER